MDQRYFLCFLCIFTHRPVAGLTPQYVLRGQNVTLTPSISGPPEQILWKHEGDKVIEFDGREEKVYSTYKNRITLDWHSAEIIIKDLQHNDTGEYELEAIINKKLVHAQHKVVVLDEVSEPTISCAMMDVSHSNRSKPDATLLCSFDPGRRPSVMKFEWESHGATKARPELNISLEGRQDESVYTCRVSNPLSTKTATFTAKDCYQVAGLTPQYVLRGQNVTLTPSISGPPEQILWKHEGDKVIEFDGREEKVYSTYKNRITLDWHSAEIIIKDLQHNDTGEYELEAIINKKLVHAQHKVVVLDEVSKPTISCAMMDVSHSNRSKPNATLLCSFDLGRRPSVMKFEWESHGATKARPELNISLAGRQDESVYTCRVSNPLSTKTATFTAKDCYQADESSPVGLIAGLVVGLLLLLIIICAALWFFRLKRSQKGLPCIERGDGRKTRSEDFAETPGLVDNHTKKPPEDIPQVLLNKTRLHEEKQPLLDRSDTLPSPQRLHGLDQRHPHTDPKDPANTHNEEAESDLITVTPTDPELPESEAGERNEPDSDGEVNDQQSDPESPATPEQPVNVTEKRQHFESLTPNPNKHGVPQKKTPLRQEKQCLLDTSDTLPSPQRLHGLDQRHPHTGPKDPANTHNEEAESDLVPVNPTDPELPESEAGEGNEPDSDGEVNDQQSDPKSPATPEQPVVVPFEAGERNEPDVEDITEDQQSDPQSSATPEQPETLELVANQTNSPVIVSHKGSVKGKAKRYDDMVTNADKQEDPEKKTPQREEKRPPLDRSNTLPSLQSLSGLDQSPPHTHPEDPANTHNEEAESDLDTITPADPELPESEAGERNEPDSDEEVKEQQSDPESPATPEQPETLELVANQTNSPVIVSHKGSVKGKAKRYDDMVTNADKQEDPEKKTPQREEKRPPLDRSNTLPSLQSLSGLDQSPPHTHPEDPANTHNEEAESDLDTITPADPELPESEAGERNEPDSDEEVKEQQSDPQSSATPEQPETLELVANQTNSPVIVSHKGSVKGKAKRYDDMVTNADKQEDPEKKTPQREEKRPPLDRSNTLPSLQSLSGLDQSPPHTHPEDPANTHNEEAESDLDTITPADPELPESEAGERNEPDSDEEVKDQQSDPESPATPEQPGSEEKAGDDGRPHSTPYTEPAETSSEPNEGVEPEQLGGKPTEVKLPESGSADSGKKDESESESDDKSPNADAKQHKEDPDSDQVATRLPEESHPESDSSGISVTNEPEPGEELQLSAAPEQSEPQITPAEPESNPSQ
ncbi:uncharacterized protein LOC143015783 isoform X11 [Genypterus blacodes]|uniref:uncharacterized protein LOC143015783 isoform X11 n=1 Tax=Genypterus blacodes TaxID=154954 RepID=UPI003F7622B4